MDTPKYQCEKCGGDHPNEAHETSSLESERRSLNIDFGADIYNGGHGEDSYLINEKEQMIGVFDGVSSREHGNGGEAARFATETADKLANTIAKATDKLDNKLSDLEYDMAKVLRMINEQIWRERGEGRDIGDTMATIAKVVEDQGKQKVVWAHVGDTRIYHIRGNTITRLSSDDTPVGELLAHGRIIQEEADNHPARNEYNKALGTEEQVAPQHGSLVLEEGDVLLGSSDGVHDVLYDVEILPVIVDGLERGQSAQEISERLINKTRVCSADPNHRKKPEEDDAVAALLIARKKK